MDQPRPGGDRRTTTARRHAAILAVALGLTATSVAAQSTLVKLAAIGDADPLGGVWSNVGTVGFAHRDEVAVEGSTGGIFASSGTGAVKVVAAGDLSPIGGVFDSFDTPAANAAGDLVFRAMLRHHLIGEGLFKRTAGGALTAVALAGDPSPDGGTFARFGRKASINSFGVVAFEAVTTLRRGLFLLLAPGVIVPIAFEGDTNPCGDPYGAFGSSSDGPVINDGIQIVFRDRGSSGTGIHLYSAGLVTAIACENAPTAMGGVYIQFGQQPTINGAGEVAFRARVDFPSPAPTVDALFLHSPAQPGCSPSACKVAAEGDAVPGGSVRGIAANVVPAIADSGEVFFLAALSPAGVGAAILRWAAGALTTEIGKGDGCPFGGVVTLLRPEITVNAALEVAVRAICTGGSGILVSAGGSLGAVATTADATAIGAGFTFRDPAIASSGSVAFQGDRTGIHVLSAGGSLTTLIAPTDPAPGIDGATIEAIAPDSASAARKGIAVLARVGGSTSADALFARKRGTWRKVVATGEEAPVAGETFASLSFTQDNRTARPSVDGNAVAFDATLSSGQAGLFWARGRRIRTVALVGGAAPDGSTYDSFSPAAVRGATIAFFAGTTAPATCLFAGRPRSPVARTCFGDAVPAPVGGTIDGFFGTPTIRGTAIVFRAAIAGGASSECLLVSRRAQPLAVLACAGDGAGPGEAFAEFAARSEGRLVANRHVASFTTTVDAMSNERLGVHRFGGGPPVPVVLAGDPLPWPIGGNADVFDDTNRLAIDRYGRLLLDVPVTNGATKKAVFLALPD